MTGTSTLAIGGLAWALTFASLGARELPATAFPAIVVRTYDAAAIPTESQQTAFLVATAILDRAGIRVSWIRCDAEVVQMAECKTPLGVYELAVRFITLRERSLTTSRPLGEAHVDVGKRAGILGTVYANRVRWFADASGVDFSTVLGRAMAHEIGHLVTGTTTHGTSGLMRAVWTPDDVDGEPWVFTDRDALALRQACRSRSPVTGA